MHQRAVGVPRQGVYAGTRGNNAGGEAGADITVGPECFDESYVKLCESIRKVGSHQLARRLLSIDVSLLFNWRELSCRSV